MTIEEQIAQLAAWLEAARVEYDEAKAAHLPVKEQASVLRRVVVRAAARVRTMEEAIKTLEEVRSGACDRDDVGY